MGSEMCIRDSISGLPAEVRNALAHMCRDSQAEHQFARYSQNLHILALHFEHFRCGDGRALCAQAGCLHQVYTSTGGRYRLLRNYCAPETVFAPRGTGGWRSSLRDCRTTIHAPCSARPAMTAATMLSGHLVPVPNTPAAASKTARLPRTSLRVQIHAERMFASPRRADEHECEGTDELRKEFGCKLVGHG